MLRKFRVKLNGKEYMVEMEEIGAVPSQAVPAASPAAPVVAEKVVSEPVQPAPVQMVGEGIKVEAPMPGNILDVMVKAGDAVKVNQPMLVLEAMKMENQIVSPVNGVIAQVLVTSGKAIDVGEVMVVIQEIN